MNELKRILDSLENNTKGEKDLITDIKNSNCSYPFSVANSLLTYFVALGELNFSEYIKISNDYLKRNKYLWLYDMAPRTYGQSWGEEHIRQLFPEFQKATKENLASQFPNFDGEFDLWIDGIRVEVKACRANYERGSGSLSSRAYLHKEAKAAGFKYHYQQLKPSCCDVFIYIGTCRDELLYWILTSEELQNTGKLGTQHRNVNTKVDGIEVFEGQIFMTEEELAPYAVEESKILEVVKEKGSK